MDQQGTVGDLPNPESNDDVDVATENATVAPRLTSNDFLATHSMNWYFFIAAVVVANVILLIVLWRRRNQNPHTRVMTINLIVADFLVTIFMIPTEVMGRLTEQWVYGNLACVLFLFLRAFGLHLSSNISICLSVERYFGILRPLKRCNAGERIQKMLAIAWVCSFLFAMPQIIMFHVLPYPEYPIKPVLQCGMYGFFMTKWEVIAYNVFNGITLFFIPLVATGYTHSKIICEIDKIRKRRSSGLAMSAIVGTVITRCMNDSVRERLRMRREDNDCLERARNLTLQTTIAMVTIFVLGWTSGVAIALCFQFNEESVTRVQYTWLQDQLYLLQIGIGCANLVLFRKIVWQSYGGCLRCFSNPCTPTPEENLD